MREDFRSVYADFEKKYGLKSQMQQCIEEMSELIKELCKYDRTVGSDGEQQTIAAIKEEIADVLNMVEQLEYCFGEKDIEDIRTEKINRSKKLYL